MSECDVYEVYAVCYAVRRDRMRWENYIASGLTDPVHDQLEPLAYFVWALRNDERTIVVDTGFDAAEAERRHEASGNVMGRLITQIDKPSIGAENDWYRLA